jgi:hypothetical protein
MKHSFWRSRMPEWHFQLGLGGVAYGRGASGAPNLIDARSHNAGILTQPTSLTHKPVKTLQSPGSSLPGTASSPSSRRKTMHSSRCGQTSTNNETGPPMIRWRRPSSACGCGRRPSATPAPRTSMQSGKPCTASACSPPSGFEVVMNTNHHLSKPAMIGKLEASGAFEVV